MSMARGQNHPTQPARFAAWGLAATALILVAGGTVLQVVTRDEDVGRYFFSLRGSTGIAVVAFALLGLLLARRSARNPIGWLFLTAGVLGGIQSATIEYAVWGLVAQSSHAPGALVAAWFNEWIWVPVVYTGGVYAVMLFPDGRLPSARWRPAVWLVSAEVVLASFTFMTGSGPMQSGLGFENPFGLEPGSAFSSVRAAGEMLFAIPFLIAAAAPVVRARRAGAVEKAQIRWLALSAAALAVVFLVGVPFVSFGDPDALLPKVFSSLMLLALTTLPVSIAIAILKYRLYDIDVIINRALVYAGLTGVLVIAYAGGVLLFRAVLDPVIGDNDIAIAASTLAVAALFGPARRRVQSFIDRRFYRSRYDARLTLDEFGARLRDEVELEALSRELLGVVSSTIKPRHASLWLARESAS